MKLDDEDRQFKHHVPLDDEDKKFKHHVPLDDEDKKFKHCVHWMMRTRSSSIVYIG